MSGASEVHEVVPGKGCPIERMTGVAQMTQVSGRRTDRSEPPAVAVNPRRTFLLGVVLSVVFFVVSFLGLAALGPGESADMRNCIIEEPGRNHAQEGQGFRYERNLWPPGIRCTYTRANGPDVSIVRPVTVGQVGFLALLCGAAGSGSAYFALRLRSRKGTSR